MIAVTQSVRAIQGSFSDPSASFPPLDPLVRGADHGVQLLFDTTFPWSYPGGSFDNPASRPAAAAPSNDAIVYDMARRANATVRQPTTGSGLTYAGGGFDSTAVTYSDTGVTGPVDLWSQIYAAANDYFLWFGYFKMPSQTDWNAGGSFVSMFGGSGATNGYVSTPDPLEVVQISGELRFARQTALNSTVSLALTGINGNHWGKVCQLMFYRNATGIYGRIAPLVPASGTLIDLSTAVSNSGATGANNGVDYSAVRSVWGVPLAWNGQPMNAAQQNASNTRVYRGGLIDLNVNTSDPIALMDADLQLTLDYYNQSKALNAGTSLIYV